MKKDVVDLFIVVLIFSSFIGIIGGLVAQAALNLSGVSAIVVGLTTVMITFTFMSGFVKTSGIKER